MIEKYRNLARDAQLAGDRVQTEYYLQFADHYFRVVSDFRASCAVLRRGRSEEHTSELQSLMRISYAVFCLQTKKDHSKRHTHTDALKLPAHYAIQVLSWTRRAIQVLLASPST